LLSFKQCAVDQAVFYKAIKHQNQLTVIAVHIDDCIIAASTTQLVNDLIEGLHNHVGVTDLGKLHWMLGIEIQCNCEAGTIHLSQQVYINTILCHFHLSDTKPLLTPMDLQVCLLSEQAPANVAKFVAMHDMPYCEAICALNWVTLATCPDIAFAVMTIAHFTVSPGPAH
jgi:hypothetical protein